MSDMKNEPKAFRSYNEYMRYIFDCVNRCLNEYLETMKTLYTNGQGGYKNVLYPDLEIASDTTQEQLLRFTREAGSDAAAGGEAEDEDDEFDLFGDSDSDEGEDEEDDDDLDIMDLLGSFGMDDEEDENEFVALGDSTDTADAATTGAAGGLSFNNIEERMEWIQESAKLARDDGISLPFFDLCEKMSFENFTVFCFACGILSSTQTDYAGVFQIINENSSLASPTIESAGKLYFGKNILLPEHTAICPPVWSSCSLCWIFV